MHYARRARTRAELVLKNILEPLALPATGGITVALAVFSILCPLLWMSEPLSAVTKDPPINLLQPARLVALAPFPVIGMEEAGHSGPSALVVEATINAEGQAVMYRILAGPDDEAVRLLLPVKSTADMPRPVANPTRKKRAKRKSGK